MSKKNRRFNWKKAGARAGGVMDAIQGRGSGSKGGSGGSGGSISRWDPGRKGKGDLSLSLVDLRGTKLGTQTPVPHSEGKGRRPETAGTVGASVAIPTSAGMIPISVGASGRGMMPKRFENEGLDVRGTETEAEVDLSTIPTEHGKARVRKVRVRRENRGARVGPISYSDE